MNEIIIAIIIVIILLLILAILFAFTVRRVNVLVRKNFIDKLQEYDFLIEDKEKKIEELNNNIEDKKKTQDEIVQKINKLTAIQEEIVIPEIDVLLPKGADFQDETTLEKYKRIKKGFNFNYENKIKDFLQTENIVDDENYYIYKGIKEYLTHKMVYKISTYSPNEQKIIINELLKDDIKEHITDLLYVKKFSIVKFVNEIDHRILMTDPKIYIYVSDVNMNFNHLNENIETIYDDSITEGFRIKYKGKIFDYSI